MLLILQPRAVSRLLCPGIAVCRELLQLPFFLGRVYEDRALQRTFEALRPLAVFTEMAILEDSREQGTPVTSSQYPG